MSHNHIRYAVAFAIALSAIAFLFLSRQSQHDGLTERQQYAQSLEQHPFHYSHNLTEEEISALPKFDRPDLAMAHDFMMTMDPSTGTVPRERLEDARRIVQEYRDDPTRYSPGDVLFPWEERGPDNVGGRTRALTYDPAVANKVWAGGVAGGLWYTNDITAASPTWVKVDDFWDNIAVCSIAFDPSDSDNIFVGTGEGFFNGDAVRGDGIWTSTDAGTTWTQIASTNGNADFDYVNDIVVTSTGTILAATTSRWCNVGGLMRSTDGGSSWSNFEGNGTDCAGSGGNDFATDLEIAANGDIYVAFGVFESDGIYKSTDDGATWSLVYAAVVGSGEQRIEIACAPSNSQIVYGLVQASGTPPIIKSVDGGASWNYMTTPLWYDQSCVTQSTDWTRGQDWYDLIAVVDPNDANTVFVGGVDIFKSSDGATSWLQVSHWWGGCFQEVHADQHSMAYKPGSSTELVFGNDGGVFYSSNANALPAAVVIDGRNSGYNVTQFYACASHPTAGSNYYLAGAQDNGTQKFTSAGMNSTTEPVGGDGAFCHIDQTNANIQTAQYTNNNAYRSTNGGASFSGLPSEATGRFINPSDYDNNQDNLYLARGTTTIRRISDVGGAATAANVTIPSLSSTASCLTVSEITTATTTLFIGTDSGQLLKVQNADTAPTSTDMDPSNALPTAYMSSIEVGATENELKVTFSNFGVSSVWHTTDAGANWANKDNGTLPDMPVRWIMTNPDNADEVILATEVGVWSTANFTNASPTWVPSNSGLANCRVDQLQLRIADNQVAAATHGRGLFTGNFFSPTFTNDAGITAVNSPVNHLVCTDTFTPSVTLKNFGSATLTQVDILYNLDGGGNTTYNWTGSLTGGSTTVVVLPSMSAATGLHTFNASTNLPNAVADEDTGNDASSSQFTATDTFVTVSIVTDAYGNETTWTITAPGGEVVGSGGPYAFQGANGAYPQPDVQVCLSSNLCYDMTVYDSFGDGMCCAYGNGSWTVKDTQGNTLVSGGTFLFSETANFCPPAPVVSNTYYSVASGNMSANIWSTTSGGAAGPAVFNCTTHLVIQNGTTVANDVGNFSALDFTVEPLGSFDLTSGGNVMSLCGNLDVDGTFIANDSKVDFQGSSAQTIGGSSNTVFYDIRLDNATGLTLLDEQSMIGGLDLQNGNFDASGATFHFVSTSTGTGRILEIQPGADYVGNMNAELNINSTSQGWRMMGMSVTGATLAQWSGDIPTTGFVGSDYPAYNFVNILSYDETLIGAQAHYDSGFVDVSNITDGLPDGEGRFVFVNGPDMCEVIGAPVKGTVSLTPSFTNSSTVLFNDGWNLAANSYQCTIDWDAATGWTRSDIDGTIYMWDNDLQQWATYTGGGVGVNGGSRYIAPQQGFWMKANAGGAVYSMTEAVKVDQYVAFVRENESFYSATIELAIYGNNWSDETALVVREGAELGFDPQYDGHKLRSTNESVPSLFTLSDDDEPLELSINTFGTLQEGQLIPLHFVVPADGEYTLSTSDFDPSEFGACLMLEDLITGESISLEPDMDYMLSAAAVDPSHRFNIVVGNTMETSALATYCPGSEDGGVVVSTTVADGTPVELYNQGDVLVATETLLNGEASFYGLGAGTYYAHVSGLVGECSELYKSFYIEQPQIATMEMVASTVDGCNASGNGMLHAMLPLGNWDITLLKDEVVVESMIFGGGDLIFDALDAGLYEIIAENDCVALHIGADLIDKLEVEAYFDGPTTIYLQENPTVSFENQSVNGSEFMWQIGELTVYSEHIASYSFTEPGLYTIHLIAYNGTCVDEYEMDVEVIGEVVSLEEFASAGDQFEVFQNQNVIMVILGRDSDIERVIFHDLLGKQVAQMNISDGQQVTTLSSSIFSTGIYTVTAYSKTQRVASEKFFVLK